MRWLLLSGAALLAACDGAPELPRSSPALVVLAAPKPKPASERKPPAPPARCPPEMIWAEGEYCSRPEHRCLRWLPDKGRFRKSRCAEYAKPAKCLTKTKPVAFCIDRDEWVAPGTELPLTGRSLPQAESHCRAAGKRLCRESEWNFACEGEELRPYPYGFRRDADACNADRPTLVGTDGVMTSLALPPGSRADCESPFGVRDMTGNVEEWVVRDDYPNRGAMKGAYWLPTRNHCRAAQRIHGPLYSGIELGFRCCRNPE